MSDEVSYPYTVTRAGLEWVVYGPQHAVKVDSASIREARYNLNRAPLKTVEQGFQEYQSLVMTPLKDALRDAIAERTQELLEDTK